MATRSTPAAKEPLTSISVRRTDAEDILAIADLYHVKVADIGGILVRGWDSLTANQKFACIGRDEMDRMVPASARRNGR